VAQQPAPTRLPSVLRAPPSVLPASSEAPVARERVLSLKAVMPKRALGEATAELENQLPRQGAEACVPVAVWLAQRTQP
jgi:hypothetical protein